MAKDARGHGSERRSGMLDVNGKGIIPNRPFREGTAHQVSIAERHGIPTDHLVTAPTRAFGARATPPSGGGPAHQSRIRQLVSAFAKSESGEGKVPAFLEEVDKDPDTLSSVAEAYTSSLADHKIDGSSLIHFAHFLGFLGFLGAVAVIDILALGLGLK